MQRTGGAIDRAQELLGWEPRFQLRDGLAAQVEWCRSMHKLQVASVA